MAAVDRFLTSTEAAERLANDRHLYAAGVGWCPSPGQIPTAVAPRQRAGERWSEVALDGEPLSMRSSCPPSTMALAETTVVETVSAGWPQVLSGPEMLLEADLLAARTKSWAAATTRGTRRWKGIAALVMI
jgi:hypothetical protein